MNTICTICGCYLPEGRECDACTNYEAYEQLERERTRDFYALPLDEQANQLWTRPEL